MSVSSANTSAAPWYTRISPSRVENATRSVRRARLTSKTVIAEMDDGKYSVYSFCPARIALPFSSLSTSAYACAVSSTHPITTVFPPTATAPHAGVSRSIVSESSNAPSLTT